MTRREGGPACLPQAALRKGSSFPRLFLVLLVFLSFKKVPVEDTRADWLKFKSLPTCDTGRAQGSCEERDRV